MTLLMIIGSDQTPAGAITARIQQGTAGTIGAIFTQDGVAVDPQDQQATVTITSDDGTVLVADQGTNRQDTGIYAYTLAGVLTEQLDRLHVEWTAVVDGYQQTVTGTVEIVGGFLFSLYAARQDSALKDTTQYTAEQLAEARTYAEQELEQACGVAFVPRYARDSVDPGCGTEIQLRPRLRALRGLRRGATVFSTATATWASTGVLHLGNLLPQVTVGSTAIDVAYEHGWDEPPAAVSRAALQLARDYLIKGPVDDRAIQLPTEDGPIFIATPGFQDKRFGIPAVDAVVDQYSYRSTISTITVTT